uniref:Uncharacterized protein n=1 Tax=Anguilla anguilla TaxID=7936 RepID=A0A0E9XDX5_ANGAN
MAVHSQKPDLWAANPVPQTTSSNQHPPSVTNSNLLIHHKACLRTVAYLKKRT